MIIEDNINPKEEGYRKIVHNAMLMNTHKDKKFLLHLMKKGKLYFKENLLEDFKEQVAVDFFKLLDLFEAKYKDQYDLGLEWKGSFFVPYFKVLYPEFTITNSLGQSHDIKDLVVVHSIAYSKDHIYTTSPEGGRFSKTILESASGYQQSHLPSFSEWKTNPFHCTTFCVGGDTDVSRMLAEFEVEMDWDRYELYLFCVDSMITWESLEGVPYRNMSTVKTALNTKVTSVNMHHVNTIVNAIIAYKIPLEVDFYLENNIFKIRPNEKANEFIKNLVLKFLDYEKYKTILVSREPDTFNQFFQMQNEAAVITTFELKVKDKYTIFRGQKIFAKTLKENTKNKVNLSLEDYIVYPNFLKNVLNKLESRIYSKAITQSGVKIYNSLSNANRSITSDTVSV